MKVYQKPAMLALSLSANDALCACANKPGETMFEDIVADWNLTDITGDGSVTKADFGNGKYFASAKDSCGEDHLITFTEYCKFSGASNVLFLS